MAEAAKSWSGIVLSNDSFEVVIRFVGDAVRTAQELPWRSSVTFKRERGGAIVMTGTFSQWWDLTPWVLGWGPDAEVLSPPELRAETASRLKAAAELY